MNPTKKNPMNFKTMSQVDVPQGRNGKHKQIITQILSDLDQLADGVALKVPLAELEESKENVRSARDPSPGAEAPLIFERVMVRVELVPFPFLLEQLSWKVAA